MYWHLTNRANPHAAAIADRHYNRQSHGSRQFTPPGRVLVFVAEHYDVLFVEINFRIQTITFRCVSKFEMQNRHALHHNFSLQQVKHFLAHQDRANGLSSLFEKSYKAEMPPSDAASGASSKRRTNGYESENRVFPFCERTVSVEKNRFMLLGKFIWQRWTAHKWPQSAFLAYSEITSEKIWYRKNAKLFDDQHDALWCSSFPYPQYVRHAWAGAWICSLFRNEAPDRYLSSELITQAVAATRFVWGQPPSLGFVTFVDAGKVSHKRDPGRCYRRAGWEHVGYTQGWSPSLATAPRSYARGSTWICSTVVLVVWRGQNT